MNTETLPPLQTSLRDTTRELHDAAEHGMFNKQLMMGRLPLSAYIDSLGQHYLIHRALEARIRETRGAVEALTTIVRDYQFQEPHLLADLAYFGRDAESIQPSAPTAMFIDRINQLAETRPIALLGVHYVFEGSKNGSKYIANALRRAYQLEGTNGLTYFDPYGDRQKEYWQTFKDDMAQIEFSTEDRAAIVQAACDTFKAVIALHDSLHATLVGESCQS